jgi:hypothetical protein
LKDHRRRAIYDVDRVAALSLKGTDMAKRVFISFAIEDEWARDYLVGQARNERSPFEFVDMSVKEPWSDSWRTRCRTRIRGVMESLPWSVRTLRKQLASYGR